MSQVDSKKWLSRILVLVYFAVAILAGYHTFNVFWVSDPWFFALLGAVAVDGVLALTLMMIGRWYGDQQVAGILGTIVFACLSGLMQVIARKLALHEVMPTWLQFVADYAVPISVTLSMITLGAIKYYDRDRNGVPDFMQKPAPPVVTHTPMAQPPTPLAIEDAVRPSSLQLNPVAFSTNNGEAEVKPKRGPGRPPSVSTASFASSEMTASPKGLRKS